MLDPVQSARNLGFEFVVPVTADMVVSRRDLRDCCNQDECAHYNTCWSCPPGSGTFEECVARIASRTEGVLVQTCRHDVGFEDADLLARIRDLHNSRLDRLADEVRLSHPDEIGFSTGGCGICNPCTYPYVPCANPAQQRLALSAHGVDIAEMCTRAGMEYSFENGTIRFIGLVLY